MGREGKIKMIERSELKICPTCGRRLTSNRYALSKNLIKVLLGLAKYCLDSQISYFNTSVVYGIDFKGSATAFLSQLKYFGLLSKYSDASDIDKISPRSGKWMVSDLGWAFLKGTAKVPSFIIVANQQVISSGELIDAHNENLKWMTESDIWIELHGGVL